jgi:hypothetical protein
MTKAERRRTDAQLAKASRPPAPVGARSTVPSKLPRNVRLGRIIAARRFRLRGRSDRTVELRIGAPRDLPDFDAYCPVQLVGIGEEKVRPIFGVDTVQALQLAVGLLESLMLQFGDQLLWEGEPAHQSVRSTAVRADLFPEFTAAFATKVAAATRPRGVRKAR